MKKKLKRAASLLLAGVMTVSLFTLSAAAGAYDNFWRVDSRGWTYEIKLTTGTGDNAATDDDVWFRIYRYAPWPGSTSDSKSDDFAEIYCDNKGDDFEKGDTGTYYLNTGIAPWMVSDMELRHGGSDGWTCSKVNVNPRAPQPSANDSRWPKTATLTNWMWSFVNFSSAKDRWLDNSDVISLKGDLITSDGKGNDFKRIINATNFSAANLGLATPIYIGKDGSVNRNSKDAFVCTEWRPLIYDDRYSPGGSYGAPNFNPYYFPVDDPPTLSASFRVGSGASENLTITNSKYFVYVPEEKYYQDEVLAKVGDDGNSRAWNDDRWSYRTVNLNASTAIYEKLASGRSPGTLTMHWDFLSRSARGLISNAFDVPVYRRVYQFGTPTVSASPALFTRSANNSYVHRGTSGWNSTITFTVPVVSVHDQADSTEKAGIAEALKDSGIKAALYNGNGTSTQIADYKAPTLSGSSLVFTFTVPHNLDTGSNGLRLQLEGTTLANYRDRGQYLCETPASAGSVAVEDNKVGFYFSSIKADTRHPYITLCDASGSDIESSLATPARTHTVYPKTSETPLYLSSSSAPGGSEENKIKYQLNDGSGAKTIGVSTGVLTNAPTTLALANHTEGRYTLTVTAQDKASNPLSITTWPVELDNKAPTVSVGSASITAEADGSKRLSRTFNVSDRNGIWRVNYCFVPENGSIPTPGSTATQVPGAPVTDSQWYFIDQTTSSTVMLKVPKGTNYTGTLYYYAVDQFGNDSRDENASQYSSVPVAVYNTPGEGTLVSDAGDYAKDSYTISFTGDGSEAYYAWDSSNENAFAKADGNIPMPGESPTGSHTLYYKFKNSTSDVFSDTRSQVFVFDNADTAIEAMLNAPLIGRSVTAGIRITDPSGIASASYQILDPEGNSVAGLEPQALTVKATREVDAAVTLAPPDNGIYNLQVTATDYNGHEKVISYDAGIEGQGALLFAIRNQAPTVDAASTDITDRTTENVPLTGGSEGYTVTVPVTEAMKHMAANSPAAGLGEQVYYQLSTDGVNWPGDSWTAVDTMEAGTDQYSLNAELQTPTPLQDGENRLFFRFACGLEAEFSSKGPDEDLISPPVELRIFKDSAGPRFTGPIYDSSFPTNKNVTATVTLRDDGTNSTGMTLTSPSGDVTVEPVEGTAGHYLVTVTENADLELIAKDRLGNETQIPVKVDWIDREAPAISGAAAETETQGARTDGNVSFTLSDRNGISVELALIDMTGVTGDTVPAPVRTEAVTDESGNFTKDPDDFDRFSELQGNGKIAVAITDDAGNTSYQVILRGLDGRYALGLYATDNVGNSTLTGIQNTVFTAVDAVPAITATAFAPTLTKSDTVATVTFNVPLAVLPQDEVQTVLPTPDPETGTETGGIGEGAAGYESVDEYNLALLCEKNVRDFRGSLSTTWRCDQTGEYKLYTLDETGRTQALTFQVTEDDVSFIEGFPIVVKYLLDGEDVTEAVAHKQWLGLAQDTILRIEVTPVEGYAGRQVFIIPAGTEQGGTALNEAESTRLTVSLLPEELRPTPEPEPSAEPADPLSEYYSMLVFDVQLNGSTTKQAVFSSYTVDGLPEDRLQTETVTLGNVDETAPVMGVVTRSPAALTNQDVTASVAFSDPESAGVTLELAEEYAFASMEATAGNAKIHFTENGSVTVHATNAAGLSADYTVAVDNIDKRPITEGTDFKIEYYYQDYLNNWTLVTGPEMACRQVKAVFVPLAAGGKTLTATAGTDILFLSDQDSSSGFFRYKDGAGNTLEREVSWTNFDRTAPSLSVEYSETPTNQDIALTVTGADAENGGTISHCEVKAADGSALAVTRDGSGGYHASIPANGNYYIRIWDLAGNSKDQTITVNSIDKTAVAISSLIYTPDRGTTGAPSYTAGSVEAYIKSFNKAGVTVTKVEPQAPLTDADIIVSANGRRIRFKDNGNVDVTYVDIYGNEHMDTLAVYSILKAPPTLDYEVTLDKTETSAVISFRQQTGPNGAPLDLVRTLADLSISAPGLLGQYTRQVTAADTLTATENGTYTVSVVDEVGNYQSLNVVVEGIDKAPPVIENVAWSYGYSLNADGTWTEQVAAGSHNVQVGETGALLTGADLIDAEGNIIRLNETNQDVVVTLTTNKPVAQVGSKDAFSTQAVMVYTENGAFRFNLSGVNDVSASYGVNVQLIDKARPVITFGGAAELTFVEGDKSGDRYDKSLLLDFTAADVKNGVTTDLTKQVVVDYGGFDPDHFDSNTFDRSKPYTITYTVYDAVGNKTVATRTLRLVSRNDVVLLVDGRLPNSSGDISVAGSTIRATLKNSAGSAYVKYLPGRYTMGEMKYKGTLVEAKNGVYVMDRLSAGWYTLALQTDNKDFLTVYVFVNGTEEGADSK